MSDKFIADGQTVDTKKLFSRTEPEIKGIFCGSELLSSGVDRVKSGTTIDLTTKE